METFLFWKYFHLLPKNPGRSRKTTLPAVNKQPHRGQHGRGMDAGSRGNQRHAVRHHGQKPVGDVKIRGNGTKQEAGARKPEGGTQKTEMGTKNRGMEQKIRGGDAKFRGRWQKIEVGSGVGLSGDGGLPAQHGKHKNRTGWGCFFGLFSINLFLLAQTALILVISEKTILLGVQL